MNELPLRIIDQPGGAVIRCLCGRELATLRRAVTSLRSMKAAARLDGLSPDITPAGLLVMVVHARQCELGREAMRHAARGDAPARSAVR